MEQTSQETTNDLLDNSESHLIRADTGKRFVNYLIDVVVFYLLAMGVGVIIALVSPSTIMEMSDDTSPFGSITDRIISLVLYGVYMGIVESIFKGKSLGKLITGTRAVNMDGSPISAGTAFSRGFSRAVPFCAFSAFGSPSNPWQDKWTDTLVIDEKQSTIVKESDRLGQ
jgi:uncharacterized RDD family membrane protein YckC